MTGGEADPATHLTISAPPEGAVVQSRDDNRMVIRSIQIKGHVSTAAIVAGTGPNAKSAVLIALVLDKNTNGLQLNSEDVYVNPSATTDGCTIPLRNLKMSSRFHVLKEWQFEVGNEDVWDGVVMKTKGSFTHFECFLKVQIPVQFSGSAEGIGTVVDNSLHVLGFATHSAIAPTLDYHARIRFDK
jgi:hypothetical protein